MPKKVGCIADQTVIAMAQAMAPQLEPVKAGREYVITVQFLERTYIEVIQRFPNFGSAMEFGMNLRKDAQDRVEVRPFIQMTEGEGRARYPELPHLDASIAAWRGWHEEAQRDMAATAFQSNYLRAIGELQA